MINVLLVDDEIISRAGLKATIPWSQYKMQVAYEATSAKEAMELLLSHADDVDLVMTDVVMPVESGIDLLRKIRAQLPDIPVVMMTYHNEFNFVRDALRLGAADYITKTELDSDSVSKVLARLEQIAQDYQRQKTHPTIDHALYRYAVYLHNGKSLSFPADIAPTEVIYNENSMLYLVPNVDSEDKLSSLERQLQADQFILLIREIKNRPLTDILYRVRIFLQQEYFYKKLPNLRSYEVSITPPEFAEISSNTLHRIREQLYSFMWLSDHDLLKNILHEISALFLPLTIVHDLFFSVRDRWQQLFHDRSPQIDEIAISGFQYWYQWVDWIEYLRQQLLTHSGYMQYSSEISGSIQKCILYLNENITHTMGMVEAASFCNLSSSYFSKCFRHITGATYVEYVRNLRMENACKLLEQTNLPISRVAELCGIPDALYFSKLFRLKYGQPPSAYRSKLR